MGSRLTTSLFPAGWARAPKPTCRRSSAGAASFYGLLPTVLVLMIRYWVLESPRWPMRMGRPTEAGNLLPALQVDPQEIALPTEVLQGDKSLWRVLFRYPRSMAAACLTGLSQTGGVGLLLWITTLFVLVLKVTPAEASYLMIYVTSMGIIVRLVCSYLAQRSSPAHFCYPTTPRGSLKRHIHTLGRN
jgi:hypothetical protein